MVRWLRIFGAGLGVALLCAGLSACGPSPADQQKAFVDFLKSDVLAKPGVRVPVLQEEDARKRFGDNAALFWVISRFHKTMDKSVSRPMQQVIAGGAPRSLEELVERRKDMETVRTGLTTMRAALDRAEAAARRERAQLPQPGDLLDVYGAAFDRLVTEPAAAFRQVFPPADDGVASALALAALLDANRSKVTLNGPIVEVTDAKLRPQVEAALAAMQSKRAALQAATDTLRRVLQGS